MENQMAMKKSGGEVLSQRDDFQIKRTMEARVNVILRCMNDYYGSV
jgi:hypothetical protein